MKDSLNNFDWSSLHDRYDEKCRGYDKKSIYLSVFEIDQPASDRDLYYELLNTFSEKQRVLTTEPIGFYEALLYWKLYSQPAAIFNTVRRLRHDISKRKGVKESLLRLFQEIPNSLERRPSAVLDMVKWLGRFNLLGMVDNKALPVRTTFLHFIYPSVVPIFDKMVLKAVDSWGEGANHNLNILEEYLPFAWELADRHEQNFSGFKKESPIRVIDMALWVGRGTDTIKSLSAQVKVAKESDTNKSYREGYNRPNKKEASPVVLSGSMPRKGDVFQGRIYDLSLWHNEGHKEEWKKRDIRYFKHEVNRKECFAYPSVGNQITLIDTDGDRYELKFSKPDTEEKICLGTPLKLKPWYVKNGFDALTVNPNDRVYFKYTGIGAEFYILTEQEYVSKFFRQE